jgi:1-acyl-sn-glycerol-3-phosphate acyltransferase
VAFAGRDERTGTERLVVMAETHLAAELEKSRLRDRIAQSSLEFLETPPDDIALAPPRTVPKTSSGKIRRSAARALYESGKIAAGSRALWLQLARLGIEGTIHRARRTVQRGAAFAYAGYWWALLVAFGLILWPLVLILPRRALRHTLLGAGGRAFLRLTDIPLEVEGSQSAVSEGRVMIVGNHASYLDGLVLAAAIPGELSSVAKHDLRRQLVAGTILERLGTIFVRRVDPKSGGEDTMAVLRAALAGARRLTFPEGTFFTNGGTAPVSPWGLPRRGASRNSRGARDHPGHTHDLARQTVVPAPRSDLSRHRRVHSPRRQRLCCSGKAPQSLPRRHPRAVGRADLAREQVELPPD